MHCSALHRGLATRTNSSSVHAKLNASVQRTIVPFKIVSSKEGPCSGNTSRGYAFKAALDEHINIGSVAFIIYSSSTASTATATSYTHPNISINYLLAPMRKFIPHVSSSHGSDSSNATQYIPNTCFYYPYGVSADGMYSAPPACAPVALSPGVGAGVVHHAFQMKQNGYYPPPGADVSCATYGGPYSLPTAATHPQQGPSATPLYHQPIPFPGAANPYAALIPHQGYLHQHDEPVLATGSAFSSLPQAPCISQKHVVEHFHYHNVKQAKIAPGRMKDDPLFGRHGAQFWKLSQAPQDEKAPRLQTREIQMLWLFQNVCIPTLK
ncbi:hypothetical protein BDR06DRAFT_975678 [Suillus hirtellus]|nr:hypothetical protein BDR06DRAFT_975678 [Suillus hirtellus]